jgi:hypothetical protein
MKSYSNKIALIRNNRGVYCIDTVMGCPSGMAATEGGCYGDCYAARSAKRYGKDFSVAVLRDFEDNGHKARIKSQIANVKMPFIRIGASGDPSEDWEHTMKIIRVLASSNTELVIITRHWNLLTYSQLGELGRMNMCINTSVSALDTDAEREKALCQFDRIKGYCKSVLRIISCDFNLDDPAGRVLAQLQDDLFTNSPTLDTVFRPSKTNPFVVSGIINTENHIFNGRKQLASKLNKRTYMGKCGSCKEMCGVNIATENTYSGRPGVTRQMLLPIK